MPYYTFQVGDRVVVFQHAATVTMALSKTCVIEYDNGWHDFVDNTQMVKLA